jgi:hypothetical protein
VTASDRRQGQTVVDEPRGDEVTYVVEAYNTATESTNKIHDDEVARTYGFRGGLVPGVDVYAYLTHVPVERWGRDWLAHGAITARFAKPVYDGHLVSVTATDDGDALDLAVVDAGDECATGRATRVPVDVKRPSPAAAPLPERRPPASADSLRPGTVLGSLTDVFDARLAASYLADIRETLPLYATVAHPGWLLRFANSILARNVVLGPWIHVSSDVSLLGVLADGEPVEVRACVLDEFERKGHRFVTLDVAIDTDDHPVQRITHTAIHTPRRLA